MEGTSTYYSTREKLPPMVNHFYVRHKRQSIRKLRVKEILLLNAINFLLIVLFCCKKLILGHK